MAVKNKKTKNDYVEMVNDECGISLRLYKSNSDKKPYYGTISVCGFAIKVNVVEGKNGFFISYPQYKNKDGEYVSLAYAYDKDIIKAVDELLEDCIDNF